MEEAHEAHNNNNSNDDDDENDVVSREMFQCVLMQSSTPELMNTLLLSGLKLRNQVFYDYIPLIISKNSTIVNDDVNDANDANDANDNDFMGSSYHSAICWE